MLEPETVARVLYEEPSINSACARLHIGKIKLRQIAAEHEVVAKALVERVEISREKRKSWGVRGGFAPAALKAETEVDDAIRRLRTAGYIPVYDAEKVLGRSFAGQYQVGRQRVSKGRLIELAQGVR